MTEVVCYPLPKSPPTPFETSDSCNQHSVYEVLVGLMIIDKGVLQYGAFLLLFYPHIIIHMQMVMFIHFFFSTLLLRVSV